MFNLIDLIYFATYKAVAERVFSKFNNIWSSKKIPNESRNFRISFDFKYNFEMDCSDF